MTNTLEFFLTPDCNLMVEERKVILARVRLDWTEDEFYSSGGTTLFIDRVSSVLGIPPWTVKVVSVFSGSTVIKASFVAEIPLDEEKQL